MSAAKVVFLHGVRLGGPNVRGLFFLFILQVLRRQDFFFFFFFSERDVSRDGFV